VNNFTKINPSSLPQETGALGNRRLVMLDCKSLALCAGALQSGWDVWRNSFAAEICQRFQNVTWNLAFFSTTDGNIGKGPQAMQAGDEVWILSGGISGGTHAYVLRKKSSDIPVYTLVGEAYVSGIIYGEVFKNLSLAYKYRHLKWVSRRQG